jgi:hypothetical protein
MKKLLNVSATSVWLLKTEKFGEQNKKNNQSEIILLKDVQVVLKVNISGLQIQNSHMLNLHYHTCQQLSLNFFALNHSKKILGRSC